MLSDVQTLAIWNGKVYENTGDTVSFDLTDDPMSRVMLQKNKITPEVLAQLVPGAEATIVFSVLVGQDLTPTVTVHLTKPCAPTQATESSITTNEN